MICSSPDLKFRSSVRRAKKQKQSLVVLQAEVRSGKVNMLTVGNVCDSLWSLAVLMHRAVAVEFRAMTDAIAVEMRQVLGPWLAANKGWTGKRLGFILKHTWKGLVTWTKRSSCELDFWLQINLLNVEAPMSFDAVSATVEAVLVAPTSGILDLSVKIYAQDTCDTGVGAAESLVSMARPTDEMFMALPVAAIKQSSNYRELFGCEATIIDVGLAQRQYPENVRKIQAKSVGKSSYYVPANPPCR